MPKSDVDIGKLLGALNDSRLQLRTTRENRKRLAEEFVGGNWSGEGSRRSVPLNLISLEVSIISRALIAKNPRAMISTFDRPNQAAVSIMEQWVNDETERIELEGTLKRVVLDALFCIGILKVSLCTPAESASSGWASSAGEPCASIVDIDDFAFDMHTRDLTKSWFLAHRYRAPLEMIRDSKLYTSHRKKLEASIDTRFNREGDEHIHTMSIAPYLETSNEFKDFVDLWEIYLPQSKRILTIADSDITGADSTNMNGAILLDQEWIGPDCGPYHFLTLGSPVPGNAIPKAPLQDTLDLHLAVNNIYRKLINQAHRQKNLTIAPGAVAEDLNRVMERSDGDAVRCDNPAQVITRDFGGPNNLNLQFAIHLADKFSYHAGNLDMMGGLSPQSKTLGQDRMLEQNASKAVSDMQDTTIGFVSKVMRSLCWYYWNHPDKSMEVSESLPGLPDINFNRTLDPEQRSMPFEKLKIKIDPYSMQHQTPSSRLANIVQTVQGLMPIMPLMQQSGNAFNVNKYLQIIAKYSDEPEFAELFSIQDPAQSQDQEQQDQGGGLLSGAKPQETTRNYVRRSVGGDTMANRSSDLMNMLSKAGTNGEQQ